MGSRKQQVFLEGPNSRWKELIFAFTVFREFIYGFRKLHFIGPCVTVFGSARFTEEHHYYTLTRKLAAEISRLGFTIITGGGPGIMEAANRGAKDVGGRSIGCNIVLPHEQKPNPYLDKWIDIDYFFIRKVLLTKYSYAFVVMPGGYGTLDEFFEAITLMQTGKTPKFPVVIMGKNYHTHLIQHVETMITEQTISAEDAQLFLFTDSIDEAVQHIKHHAIKEFGLKKTKVMRHWSWLGESK